MIVRRHSRLPRQLFLSDLEIRMGIPWGPAGMVGRDQLHLDHYYLHSTVSNPSYKMQVCENRRHSAPLSSCLLGVIHEVNTVLKNLESKGKNLLNHGPFGRVEGP